MDTTNVALGVLLLLVSSVILFANSAVGSTVPIVLASVAAVGMSAGALLLGTSTKDGRPV